MITVRDYRRKLLALQHAAGKLVVDTEEGADMKEVNEKLIEITRAGYEFALKYKGQEEGTES